MLSLSITSASMLLLYFLPYSLLRPYYCTLDAIYLFCSCSLHSASITLFHIRFNAPVTFSTITVPMLLLYLPYSFQCSSGTPYTSRYRYVSWKCDNLKFCNFSVWRLWCSKDTRHELQYIISHSCTLVLKALMHVSLCLVLLNRLIHMIRYIEIEYTFHTKFAMCRSDGFLQLSQFFMSSCS